MRFRGRAIPGPSVPAQPARHAPPGGDGEGLTLDDDGAGYSSPSFPIGTLKVDKSFIRDALEDSGGEAIVAAIVAMAHSLNPTVVAEGVETEE
jgi:EAL domain-containing protein (putative c-di-GMP-specific phosphodiesterase class I)